MRISSVATVVGMVVLGCNQNEVPIGGGNALLGEWDGYMENLQFASGSDAVHMSITAADSGGAQGTITFGTPASFPPPTDPEVGYPVPGGRCLANDAPLGPMPAEGFAYSILDSNVTDLRMRFGVDSEELWTPWCELQQSPVLNSDGWECMKQYSVEHDDGLCYLLDGNHTEADCCRISLCRDVCDCSETSCTHDIDPTLVRFDITVDGDDADGSMLVNPQFGGDSNVLRLTRSQ